jgi:hypothetical protein
MKPDTVVFLSQRQKFFEPINDPLPGGLLFRKPADIQASYIITWDIVGVINEWFNFSIDVNLIRSAGVTVDLEFVMVIPDEVFNCIDVSNTALEGVQVGVVINADQQEVEVAGARAADFAIWIWWFRCHWI